MAADSRKLLLWYGKVDVNRPHLVDDHQRVGVIGLDHVADLQHHLADKAVYGGTDGAVLELQFRVFNRGRAPQRDCFCGVRVGADLRIRFLGNKILLQQFLVAPLLRTRLLLLCGIAHQIGLGLAQRCLVRTRIDLEQDGAFSYLLTFLEVDFDNLTVHARLQRYRGVSLDIADRLDAHCDSL